MGLLCLSYVAAVASLVNEEHYEQHDKGLQTECHPECSPPGPSGCHNVITKHGREIDTGREDREPNAYHSCLLVKEEHILNESKARCEAAR